MTKYFRLQTIAVVIFVLGFASLAVSLAWRELAERRAEAARGRDTLCCECGQCNTPQPTTVPSPEPSTVPSPEPTPVASPVPSPSPSESPTPVASPVPSPAASPVPSPTPSEKPDDKDDDDHDDDDDDDRDDDNGVGGPSNDSSGDVLGADTMASTGAFADLVLNTLGNLGGILTVTGSALYARQRKNQLHK